MVYKNFINRSIVSLCIFILYSLISIYNFELVLYLAIFIYLFILLEVLINFKKYKYLVIFYIFLSMISLYFIEFKQINLIKFNLLIVIVISFDIFSYLTGVSLGKIKISKIISPNKTLEGLLGGISFSILISIAYSYIFNIEINLNLIIFIILVIFSSFIGDIFESIFKRLNYLKNSSNFLPGHGGFFDRFDSFILSIIIYSIFNHLLWRN